MRMRMKIEEDRLTDVDMFMVILGVCLAKIAGYCARKMSTCFK
jgi:hypothetical protein